MKKMANQYLAKANAMADKTSKAYYDLMCRYHDCMAEYHDDRVGSAGVDDDKETKQWESIARSATITST